MLPTHMFLRLTCFSDSIEDVLVLLPTPLRTFYVLPTHMFLRLTIEDVLVLPTHN